MLLFLVQSIYENYWHNLKQIATEFFSAGMHSGEVSLKHIKNPLRHLWGKQVKSAIKVTFSHYFYEDSLDINFRVSYVKDGL